MLFTQAEQSAMRLDGELLALGTGSIHVAAVASAQDRAAGLGVALPASHVVAGRAAAWVHGCGAWPMHVEVLVMPHVRAARLKDPRIRVFRRTLHFERESETIGCLRVLSPSRTADWLESASDATADDLAAARLLRQGLSQR